MPWKKQKRIFDVVDYGGWMRTHTQVPTVLVTDSVVRVYFATRPEPGISMTTFFDLDPEGLERVEYVHDGPIIPLGKPGTFDEFGVMPNCAIEHDGRVFLYTSGWTRGVTVPYINAVGLAISEDGGRTFERYSDGPLLGRTPDEPYSAMAPYVLKDGDKWQMWYSSFTGWTQVNGKYEPLYSIKFASSDDGLNWVRKNEACILPAHAEEVNVRASVLFEEGHYRMWYSFRGIRDFRGGRDSYRIGYATATHPTNWIRQDEEVGITVSKEGWDSEMIAYPQVVRTQKGLTMFYNGNGFGASGIGYALWDDDEA